MSLKDVPAKVQAEETYLSMLVGTVSKYLTLIGVGASLLAYLYFYVYYWQFGIPLHAYLDIDEAFQMFLGFAVLIIMFESIDIASIWLGRESIKWSWALRFGLSFLSSVLIALPLSFLIVPELRTLLFENLSMFNQLGVFLSLFLVICLLAGACILAGSFFPIVFNYKPILFALIGLVVLMAGLIWAASSVRTQTVNGRTSFSCPTFQSGGPCFDCRRYIGETKRHLFYWDYAAESALAVDKSAAKFLVYHQKSSDIAIYPPGCEASPANIQE